MFAFVSVSVCVCAPTYEHHPFPPHPLRSSDKGQKLQEAWEQQQFLRAVEDIEDWIGDMESQMASEDLGRDLISVNNLIKKHAVRQSICCLSVFLSFLSTFLWVCLSFLSVLSVSMSDHILQFHEDTHAFLLPTSSTGILCLTLTHTSTSFTYSLFTTPLQLLENDIQAQQGRIDDIMAQVRRFREANHFQSDQIEDRGRELVAK